MHACGDPACAYMRGLHNGEGEEGCCKCGRVGTNTERIQEKRNGGRVWDLERYKPERGASCIVRMWVGIMRCAIEDGELVSFREMTHARRRAWGHRACTHGDPACVPGPRMHGGDPVRACQVHACTVGTQCMRACVQGSSMGIGIQRSQQRVSAAYEGTP